ncbi:MAG: DEAD/DEAH box helicase [Christensenellales bacterium]|jgi:DEAD/DEAH box helicase domain-containing protein
MNLTQLLDRMRADKAFADNITHWEVLPAQDAEYVSFPEGIDPRLTQAYIKKGITKLYTHQAEAVSGIFEGKDTVVVTPTASGKTLCYNLPVLNRILERPEARALYIFPTKALSNDQLSELYEIIEIADIPIKTYTYDGDTPPAARKAIRSAGHIVVTNPDMLHGAILPNHTKWIQLFENLEYIVVDELHTYRGVFGSHLCNVLRRLLRICDFYGSHPKFICCSATIANPKELAEQILERPVTLVDKNGAPSGEKHFLFYNPPVINRQLGIRAGSDNEARNIAVELLANDIPTIVFIKSRVRLEVMVSALKESISRRMGKSDIVCGYRGGYLPSERRAIERDLRSGRIKGVVSTNALELGIDIGSLAACVIVGYPGTIASTWQQSGRAGRRDDVSVTIMVANSSPLCQFIIQHPEYFFGRSPEHGLIQPDNLYILMSHIKCAAYELPFRDGDAFGPNDISEILGFLEEGGMLHHSGKTWHWSDEDFPSAQVSLRSAANENFIIIDITLPKRNVLGEMDRFAAPMLLHEEAIYMHNGVQYQVEKLDWPEKKAYVRRVDVDYYTDANLAVKLHVLDVIEPDTDPETETGVSHSWGEISVVALVSLFKKMTLETHENIGSGEVRLPEQEMHTTAYWVCLPTAEDTGITDAIMQSALLGLSNLISILAPVYLMCDPKDISVLTEMRSPFTRRPTIFVYDTCPGGVGFSQKLYQMRYHLWEDALQVVTNCCCLNGCPSCVGPDSEKLTTRKLLEVLLHDTKS